jgi:hypothetical protein
VSYLLIDPRVGPYDPPTRISTWLTRLEGMRRERAGDPEALESIARAEEGGRRYLELAVAVQVANERRPRGEALAASGGLS